MIKNFFGFNSLNNGKFHAHLSTRLVFSSVRSVIKKLHHSPPVDHDELSSIVGYLHLEHLKLPYLNLSHEENEKCKGLFTEAWKTIRKIIGSRNYVPFQDGSLRFIASYPRSGNTFLLDSIEKIVPAQWLTSDIGISNYIPLECFPKEYPLFRIVKTHTMPIYDVNSKYIFIIRDGRDLLPSIAFMCMREGAHNFSRRSELADFIDWQCNHFRFGGWAELTKDMLTMSQKANVLIVRYDKLVNDIVELEKIITFLDLPYKKQQVESVYTNKNTLLDTIKTQKANNKFWGIGEEFPQDSLYYHWSNNRTKSNWRETMDREARKRFHESGATELLIELGFESDPEWWR